MVLLPRYIYLIYNDVLTYLHKALTNKQIIGTKGNCRKNRVEEQRYNVETWCVVVAYDEMFKKDNLIISWEEANIKEIVSENRQMGRE